VLIARVALSGTRYDSAGPRRDFWLELDRRIGALPGVQAAGLTSVAPMGGAPYFSVQVEGRPNDPSMMNDAQPYAVTPGFFEAVRIRLVRGRLLTEQDGADAPRVAVINETMAKKFYGEKDPIGSRVSFDGSTWVTVVGIVGDTRQEGLADIPYAQLYRPISQFGRPAMWATVRTAGDPAATTNALRRVVAELDPQLPVYGATTLEERIARSVAQPRLTAMLTGIFAAAALLLAALGIYGVVAYGVAERTREIGVRMALGATRANVLGLVVRQGMLPVAGGLVVGLAGAWASSRLIARLLYGVSPGDVVTYTGVVGFLAVVALVATVLPARRASAIEPTQALRYE
jgi:putative ABC transport system permease protein